MRERMERFVVLPFSVGCVSQSSVAVIDTQTRKTTMDSNPSPEGFYREERECFAAAVKARPPFGFPPVNRPSIPAGLQRLIKSFKGLSQLFTLYREEDEEVEMEISFPTDVKHVAHVGWDATGDAPAMTGWDRGPELLALPSISFRKFELAMAAQADAPPPYKSPF